MCSDSLLVFQHMLSTGVGVTHAVVYEAYARTLEEGGEKEKAMEVLQDGIARKAFPEKRLQKRLE